MPSGRASTPSLTDLLPDRLEEVVHRRAGTQMRVMLDGIAAGAGARGPVRFKNTVGEDRALPDLDRVVSKRRGVGKKIIATARDLLAIVYKSLIDCRIFQEFPTFKRWLDPTRLGSHQERRRDDDQGYR